MVAAQIEGMFAETLLPEEIAQVAGLLDALGAQGFLERRPGRRAPRCSSAWPTPTPTRSSA